MCAPPVAAPAGCASCAALTARVAELEKARPTARVPREVRTEIYQTAALEKENADLRERLARGRARACALPGDGRLAVGRDGKSSWSSGVSGLSRG